MFDIGQTRPLFIFILVVVARVAHGLERAGRALGLHVCTTASVVSDTAHAVESRLFPREVVLAVMHGPAEVDERRVEVWEVLRALPSREETCEWMYSLDKSPWEAHNVLVAKYLAGTAITAEEVAFVPTVREALEHPAASQQPLRLSV